MQKSIKRIRTDLITILATDTNQVLTLSSPNKELQQLVKDLNKELKILRNQKLQYENGNQQLKSTITNISHDIRTPLTAISGYIDLMKEEKVGQNYIEILERKTKDLLILTEQLVDFSKTVDISAHIQKERHCLNTILEETIANYYPIFKEHHIQPQIEICQEKVYRKIDKNTVSRVLENILSNAIKYSEGDIKIQCKSNGTILFCNQTSALDAITVQKIFNRYYTIGNSQKSTGIGLSIAKQLVELNGGCIQAQYIENQFIMEIQF